MHQKFIYIYYIYDEYRKSKKRLNPNFKFVTNIDHIVLPNHYK